jgi:hypothetical protein
MLPPSLPSLPSPGSPQPLGPAQRFLWALRPSDKVLDGEFPAWAICQAIRSTSWRGDGLKAYNPRDVLKFLDEMVERKIVSGFDSDDQERMLRSIVGKFNAWGSEL